MTIGKRHYTSYLVQDLLPSLSKTKPTTSYWVPVKFHQSLALGTCNFRFILSSQYSYIGEAIRNEPIKNWKVYAQERNNTKSPLKTTPPHCAAVFVLQSDSVNRSIRGSTRGVAMSSIQHIARQLERKNMVQRKNVHNKRASSAFNFEIDKLKHNDPKVFYHSLLCLR